MNRDDMVDAIIREVKRVLELRGIDLNQGGDRPVRSPQTPVQSSPARPVVPRTPTAQSPSESSLMVGIRDLSGKQVITARDLEQFQGQSVTVTPNAVITPMAKDYAREKKITFVKSSGATGNPGTSGMSGNPGTPVSSGSCAAASAVPSAQVTVTLAVERDFPGGATTVKAYLAAKGFAVREMSGVSYEAMVDELAKTVSDGSAAFGICIERTGMLAPIQANRQQGIRAVHCREVLDARAARIDIGANVLVLDAGSNPEAVIGGYIGL